MKRTQGAQRTMTIKAVAPVERAYVPGYIEGPNGLVRFATDQERDLLGTIDRLKLVAFVAFISLLMMTGAFLGTLLGVLL